MLQGGKSTSCPPQVASAASTACRLLPSRTPSLSTAMGTGTPGQSQDADCPACYVAEFLPGCLAAWLPGCLAAWLPLCLAAWLPGTMPWLPGWIPGCLVRCPAVWLAGLQGRTRHLRCSGMSKQTADRLPAYMQRAHFAVLVLIFTNAGIVCINPHTYHIVFRFRPALRPALSLFKQYWF